MLYLDARPAVADDGASPAAERPAILADRWREDWSRLADPRLRTQPFDELKFIPLGAHAPDSYLSLGLTLRESFERSDAPAFGTSEDQPSDTYGLQRLQFHVDLRLNKNLQIFTQFEDVRTFDKKTISSTEANRLDLRLAFLGYTVPLDAGTFRARIGRQDFEFDLERFLSSRDGPNVRQSFDAVWAGWESDEWRFYGLVSQPVEYLDGHPFDDRSTRDIRFSGVRAERQLSDWMQLTGYYALYQRRNALYLHASGEEDRHILDMRLAGAHSGFDWDVEAMGQLGHVGRADVRAWAFGARTGYTIRDVVWSPRIGLQFDAASGDRRADDGNLGTFNPLFPNGYYFSLGGHTGYTNLVHLKPSLTVAPIKNLTLLAGIGLLWRQTTKDAVYVLPSVPVLGTAGRGTSWTGAYAQLRADYRFASNLTGSVEAVRYDVGSDLQFAGGKDSIFFRSELKFSW
ncbi:alginate export family protein [Chenggangzhangella methanolivorans]|uniref:alginate export family protein n=1 Tax=Chenggangzhangella methanolivorans TaxID=1437009 RepID=UPI00360E6B57